MEGLRGQNRHAAERRWETAPEGDQGQPRTANCLVCPDARAWRRVTWQQRHGDTMKITSWSCHGYRTMMRHGGLPVTLSAVADNGHGGSRKGRLGAYTLSLSQSSVAG